MFHSTDEANDKEMIDANKIYTQLWKQKSSSIYVLLISTCFPEITFTNLNELRQKRPELLILVITEKLQPKCKSPDFPNCNHNHDKRRNTLTFDNKEKEIINNLATSLSEPLPNSELLKKVTGCRMYKFDCVVFYKHLIFYVGMSKKDPSFPHITCSGNLKKKKNLNEIDDEIINHYQKRVCNKCPNIFRKFVFNK